MRFDGTLEKWNDDRGFGFIKAAHGGEQVFVHVSAFARDGHRPTVGERLSFEVEPAGDGRKRAVKVQRPGQAVMRSAPAASTAPRPRIRPARSGSSLSRWSIVGILLVGGLGVALADRFGANVRSTAPVHQSYSPAQPAQAASRFRCDGRTMCSQMTSCEEATFFLKNCPGTTMDGNNDGIPCERQWCGRR